jgi:hypothetical protein
VSLKAVASASIYVQSKNALRIKTLALYTQEIYVYIYHIITSGYQSRPLPGDPSNDARGKTRHPLATA